MTSFAIPGLYSQSARPVRRLGGLARGDIPLLMGYTTRGPAMEPVRVDSLRQFNAIFGLAPAGTHLADAVKGFFETGGRQAYILRLTGPDTNLAQVKLGPDTQSKRWSAIARYRLDTISPKLPGAESDTRFQPWQEHLRRKYGNDLPDPGNWADDLEISVKQVSRIQIELISISSGGDIEVPSVYGLQPHMLVNISQDQDAQTLTTTIEKVDTARGTIQLTDPVAVFFVPQGGAADPVVMLKAISFDIEIFQEGISIERFDDVTLNPAHPRSIENTVNARSQVLSLGGPDTQDWSNENHWPNAGRFSLAGGLDGLDKISTSEYEAGLRAAAQIDEIALVAAPDLTFQNQDEAKEEPEFVPNGLDCDLLLPPPAGKILGVITNSVTDAPVPDVSVYAVGQAQITTSDEDGKFTLSNLREGLVELRFSAESYQKVELSFQAAANQSDVEEISMVSISTIRTMDESDIQAVQNMMANPLIAGLYRVAVIDPPRPEMTPQGLLDWRAALGANARLFAVAPWLKVPQDIGAPRSLPPSGHICGAFAAAEQQHGVHRAPANIPLRFAKQVETTFGQPDLAAFHQVGLNPVRALSGQGIRLMGSRTLYPDFEWQQVSVRRLFDALEKTLSAQFQWAVFETNGIVIRQILKFSIEQLLETMHKRGMFAGESAKAAYFVKCDDENNTRADIDSGHLTVEIAVAPTRPYEFILFQLSATADAIEVTEVS